MKPNKPRKVEKVTYIKTGKQSIITHVEDNGICHIQYDDKTTDCFIWKFSDGSINNLHEWL